MLAQVISGENDRTLQAQAILGVSLAVVGTASWGKFNEKVVCGNEQALIKNAGYPISQDPKCVFFIGKEFTKVSQNFTYVRVGDGTEAEAKVDIEDTQTTPAKTFEIKAIYKGTFGNRIKVKIENGTKENTKKLSIYITNTQGVDVFTNVMFDNLVKTTSSDDYYETKINGKNDYIEIVDVEANTNQPVNATYILTGGLDGSSVDDADIIGTITGNVKTGLKLFADKKANQYTLVACPGVSSQAVHIELLSLAETTYTFALIDSPKGLTHTTIQDWFNATGTYNGQSAYDSSHGATDWGWTLVKDSYNDEDIYLPPSVGLAYAVGYSFFKMGNIDYAPTGLKRGKLSFAKGVEYNMTESEANVLQSNGNRINPVINFAGQGITRWGNDTMQRMTSALTNIHSRLILNNIKQTIESAMNYILFDPHIDEAQDDFINVVEPVCERHKTSRGLDDYRVICDTSNNSEVDRSQEILRGSIEVIFTPKIKAIIIDYVLLPTGSVLTERTV